MWQRCWVSEWVQSLVCDKCGWQTHTPSSGDAHHTWSCGNNVAAHCLYTGKHVVTENSRDKHILVLGGSLGKQESFTFLAVEQWRQRTAQTPTDGRQNLDEHPVTSMCRTVATEHIACWTVLWVLHKQLFILSHLQWVKGIYLKGQSFVRGSCSSVPVVITLSIMLCRGAAELTCDTIMNFHNQY
jgi:hypothetical protein